MSTVGAGEASAGDRESERPRAPRGAIATHSGARDHLAEHATCGVCAAPMGDVGFLSGAGAVCETCSLVVDAEQAVLQQVQRAFGPLVVAGLCLVVGVLVALATGGRGPIYEGKGAVVSWIAIWIVMGGTSLIGAAGSLSMLRATRTLSHLEHVTVPRGLRLCLILGAGGAASSGLLAAAIWTLFFLQGPGRF